MRIHINLWFTCKSSVNYDAVIFFHVKKYHISLFSVCFLTSQKTNLLHRFTFQIFLAAGQISRLWPVNVFASVMNTLLLATGEEEILLPGFCFLRIRSFACRKRRGPTRLYLKKKKKKRHINIRMWTWQQNIWSISVKALTQWSDQYTSEWAFIVRAFAFTAALCSSSSLLPGDAADSISKKK